MFVLGMLIADSPLMISVVDARLVTFSGPTLVPVGKSTMLKANTEAAGKAKMVATMTCKLTPLPLFTAKMVKQGMKL